MPDLGDGESVEMKGSGAKPYVLKNVGGVYSCTCPAWRNQSVAIERRTCKHLRKLRGDAAEAGPRRAGPAAQARGRRRGRRERREGRAAAAPGRALGQRPGPGRLVDEREARRRPRLLGRQVADLAPGQPLPRPRLVHRRACPRSRSTASCGSAARRSSAPSASSAGRTRPTSGRRSRYVVFDAPALDARVRGPARLRPRPRRAAPAAAPAGPTSTRPARAWTTSAPSWRGSRRWAARG